MVLELGLFFCLKAEFPLALGPVKLLHVSLAKWGDKPATLRLLVAVVITMVVIIIP